MPERSKNPSPVGVVHLARAKNGVKPFADFLQSYRQYPAGLAHDLVIVYKGFRNREEIAPWERAVGDIPHELILIPDIGFDLRAYRIAAERLVNPHLFCLNSFSEILSEGWLEKTFTLMRREGIGIVGATGSWESMYSNAAKDFEGIAAPALVKRLTGYARLIGCQLCFDPFPNPHIRTTAFMMSREVMLRVWPRYILTKRGAYLFENGKNSLTKRILGTGLRPIVAGKDGLGYEKEDWARSNTFRKSNQENLLVADNQTRLYQNAEVQTRLRLSAFAWGT